MATYIGLNPAQEPAEEVRLKEWLLKHPRELGKDIAKVYEAVNGSKQEKKKLMPTLFQLETHGNKVLRKAVEDFEFIKSSGFNTRSKQWAAAAGHFGYSVNYEKVRLPKTKIKYCFASKEILFLCRKKTSILLRSVWKVLCSYWA